MNKAFLVKKNRVFEYVRSRNLKNEPIGLLVAEEIDDKIVIGWSMCFRAFKKCLPEINNNLIKKQNSSNGIIDIRLETYKQSDKIDWKRGLKIALVRGEKHFNDKIFCVPSSIIKQFIYFKERVVKYYKNGEFPIWVENNEIYKKEKICVD